MSLPNVEDVRQRIESVGKGDVRLCLKATYLFCGRICEVVGRATANEQAYGITGKAISVQKYKRQKVVVFKVKTAKRQGRERPIALPLEDKFEPWAREVARYILERGKSFAFPFTRQKMWMYSKDVFAGLSYPIERYEVIVEDQNVQLKPYEKLIEVDSKEGVKLVKVVGIHENPFRLHALRHLRASELVEFYGFNPIELSVYGGWTLKRGAGMSTVMERYLSLNWQSYFPKLLKSRGLEDVE